MSLWKGTLNDLSVFLFCEFFFFLTYGVLECCGFEWEMATVYVCIYIYIYIYIYILCGVRK